MAVFDNLRSVKSKTEVVTSGINATTIDLTLDIGKTYYVIIGRSSYGSTITINNADKTVINDHNMTACFAIIPKSTNVSITSGTTKLSYVVIG